MCTSVHMCLQFFTFTRTCVAQALSKLCSSHPRPCLSWVSRTTSSFCSTPPSLSQTTLHRTGIRNSLNAALTQPSLFLLLFFPTTCSTLSESSKLSKKLSMLIRRRRLFHSSLLKLPFVNMSASWFVVSMLTRVVS